jgi:hypothetical protein
MRKSHADLRSVYWSDVMKCPVCPDATLSVGSREGIEIDYCPHCRGV